MKQIQRSVDIQEKLIRRVQDAGSKPRLLVKTLEPCNGHKWAVARQYSRIYTNNMETFASPSQAKPPSTEDGNTSSQPLFEQINPSGSKIYPEPDEIIVSESLTDLTPHEG